jgi:CspA family cold shock protein
MATGTVKWFNNAKGYGFICPTGGGEDIFAHFSTVMMDGYKSLKAGQGVSFEVSRGPKGLHAIDIRAIDDNVQESFKEETGTKSREHKDELEVAFAD